jgi:eukaryotic-like serine/threonine-protein kinase
MTDGDPVRHGALTDPAGRTFELVGLLGRGGFGEVHLAVMHSPGGLVQQVALKLLRPEGDPDSRPIERLRDEARLLANLRHPSILAAHDLAVVDGRVALITEFVEGQDLAAVTADEADPIPHSALLEVVEAVASALHVAWTELRVVHRDVKAQNIRVGMHGNVKLLDFGIARSEVAVRDVHTASSILVGTVSHLAPERFQLARRPDPASDVFALGVVLFNGVTHSSFYGRLEVPDIAALAADAGEWAGFVEERLSRPMPEAIRSLLRDMMAHRPEARPTAGEVAQRCEALLARWEQPIPLRRWCRARRWPSRVPRGHAAPVAPTVVTSTLGTSWASSSSGPAPGLEPSLAGGERAPGVPSPAPPTRARRIRWAGWVAATLLSAGTVGSLGIGVLAAAALVLAWAFAPGRDEVPPAAPVHVEPEPVRVIAPAPAPPEPPPAAPEPAPDPPTVVRPRPPAPAPVAAPVPSHGYEITITSVPMGVEVQLGEVALGRTPLVHTFPAGAHEVRLVAPWGAESERTLHVRKNAPVRFVWYAEDDRWESGL